MSRTPTHLHRTNYTSTAPTPGFRGASGTDTLRSDHGPSPRLDRGGDPRRQTQGCDNRIAQTNLPVSQNRPTSEVSHASFALNGALQAPETSFRSSGGAAGRPDSAQPDPVRRQALAGQLRVAQGGAGVLGAPDVRLQGQAPQIDRSACSAKPGAHDPKRAGTFSAYHNFKCRCPDAREAHRLRKKRRREGRSTPPTVDSTGTARRLQALACMGYNMHNLAAWFAERPQLIASYPGRGVMAASRICQLRRPMNPRIWAPQAQLIEVVYRALAETPAPPSADTDRTRRYAARQGWAPPAAWDNVDDTSELPKHQLPDANGEAELELLMAGQLPPEKSDHRSQLNDEAVRILDEKGATATQMAALLKLSVRSVVRVRSRIGISHVAPPTEADTNPGIVRADRRNTQPKAEAPHSAHERGTTAA